MPDLSYDQIHAALAAQSLFEDKTWQLLAGSVAGDARPSGATRGHRCGVFGVSPGLLGTLYLRSVAGKNLLRNKPLLAPWVADYLDRGKPAQLVEHARDPKNRGMFPTVIRPDLLLTDEGFVMTELDSVPGGIGLTAFLNRLYEGKPGESSPSAKAIIGQGDAMIKNFHASLTALRPGMRNPLIALVVSDEAATYRPEMQWLAHQLQVQGQRVFCMRPEDLFPLGSEASSSMSRATRRRSISSTVSLSLFDLANVRTANYVFEAWSAGEVAIAPPMRPFQEEKLNLALFHHHLLQDFWAESLSARSLKLLRALIPPSWIIDPAPLPPGAVLDGPRVGGRALSNWGELAGASQKERDLIIKISGFHETAWGARSLVLGSYCSRVEWQQGIEHAVEHAPTNLHVLQAYKKHSRLEHRVYDRPLRGGLVRRGFSEAGDASGCLPVLFCD